MKIIFKTKKLEKILNSERLIKKHYGKNAKKIMMRLSEINAVENLENLMTLPGRFHNLKGERKNTFACDLKHPFRLIFEPSNDPIPTDDNNKIIYSKITEIKILEIKDYY